MLNDSFYTPPILAEKLLAYSKKKNFYTAVDFCVGDGELLRAAKNKWPHLQCFGSDISKSAISSTQLAHPDWKLFHLDFLDDIARGKNKIIKKKGKFDLILLNPPFSCKGGTIHQVEVDGKKFQCSTAMKFVVTALNYLSTNGVMYAILPTSSAYSQKDSKLWSELESRYNLAILDEPKSQYFKGCAPNIVIVSLNDVSQSSQYTPPTRIPLEFEGLNITRGKLSMNMVKVSSSGLPLVHSTNINNNQLNKPIITVDAPNSIVQGPAVLIPRVGKPKSSKICVISSSERYVISDCIIAIKTGSAKKADILFRYLIDNWDVVENIFKGTGARYTTIDKVKEFLNLDIAVLKKTSAKVI